MRRCSSARLNAVTSRMEALHPWLRWLQRRFLPWRCQLCGAPGAEGIDLCVGCIADMPRNVACCARCAVPLPIATPLCGACQRRPPDWDMAWAPYQYGWPLDRLESRFKFHGDLASGRSLATLWRQTPRPACLPHMLIAVPLHRARLRQRGYNQALELIRPLARQLDVPLRHDLLERIRGSAPQTDLDAAARRRNVRGIFKVAHQARWPAHVAVVDDVMTTGSTLAECARVLKRAGVARVDVWALARAPRLR